MIIDCTVKPFDLLISYLYVYNKDGESLYPIRFNTEEGFYDVYEIEREVEMPGRFLCAIYFKEDGEGNPLIKRVFEPFVVIMKFGEVNYFLASTWGFW